MESSVVRLLGSTPKMRLSSGACTGGGAAGCTADGSASGDGDGAACGALCPSAGTLQPRAAKSAKITRDPKRLSGILFLNRGLSQLDAFPAFPFRQLAAWLGVFPSAVIRARPRKVP